MEYEWDHSDKEPYHWMVNDLYRGIQAEQNYLVALGIFSYSEILGREISDSINKKGGGSDCFREFTEKYIGYEFTDWENIFDDIRNGLAHRYFIKNRLGTICNDNGDLPCGIVENADKIDIHINTYFRHFVKGLKKYLDQNKPKSS